MLTRLLPCSYDRSPAWAAAGAGGANASALADAVEWRDDYRYGVQLSIIEGAGVISVFDTAALVQAIINGLVLLGVAMTVTLAVAKNEMLLGPRGKMYSMSMNTYLRPAREVVKYLANGLIANTSYKSINGDLKRAINGEDVKALLEQDDVEARVRELCRHRIANEERRELVVARATAAIMRSADKARVLSHKRAHAKHKAALKKHKGSVKKAKQEAPLPEKEPDGLLVDEWVDAASDDTLSFDGMVTLLDQLFAHHDLDKEEDEDEEEEEEEEDDDEDDEDEEEEDDDDDEDEDEEEDDDEEDDEEKPSKGKKRV